MVFCPSCSEQQDDTTLFCRFCGGTLPGPKTMAKLRQEALSLASIRAGKDLSSVQSENEKTMQLVGRNATNNSNTPVNNNQHRNTTQQVTSNLKNLLQDF